MTAALSFEGYVATMVPTDDPAGYDNAGMTVRVGGDDLLAMVHEAAREFSGPMTGVFILGSQGPIVGELAVSRGYDVPCCEPGLCDYGDYGPPVLQVGDTDLLDLLERHEGDQVRLDVIVGAQQPERVGV